MASVADMYSGVGQSKSASRRALPPSEVLFEELAKVAHTPEPPAVHIPLSVGFRRGAPTVTYQSGDMGAVQMRSGAGVQVEALVDAFSAHARKLRGCDIVAVFQHWDFADPNRLVAHNLSLSLTVAALRSAGGGGGGDGAPLSAILRAPAGLLQAFVLPRGDANDTTRTTWELSEDRALLYTAAQRAHVRVRGRAAGVPLSPDEVQTRLAALLMAGGEVATQRRLVPVPLRDALRFSRDVRGAAWSDDAGQHLAAAGCAGSTAGAVAAVAAPPERDEVVLDALRESVATVAAHLSMLAHGVPVLRLQLLHKVLPSGAVCLLGAAEVPVLAPGASLAASPADVSRCTRACFLVPHPSLAAGPSVALAHSSVLLESLLEAGPASVPVRPVAAATSVAATLDSASGAWNPEVHFYRAPHAPVRETAMPGTLRPAAGSPSSRREAKAAVVAARRAAAAAEAEAHEQRVATHTAVLTLGLPHAVPPSPRGVAEALAASKRAGRPNDAAFAPTAPNTAWAPAWDQRVHATERHMARGDVLLERAVPASTRLRAAYAEHAAFREAQSTVRGQAATAAAKQAVAARAAAVGVDAATLALLEAQGTDVAAALGKAASTAPVGSGGMDLSTLGNIGRGSFKRSEAEVMAAPGGARGEAARTRRATRNAAFARKSLPRLTPAGRPSAQNWLASMGAQEQHGVAEDAAGSGLWRALAAAGPPRLAHAAAAARHSPPPSPPTALGGASLASLSSPFSSLSVGSGSLMLPQPAGSLADAQDVGAEVAAREGDLLSRKVALTRAFPGETAAHSASSLPRLPLRATADGAPVLPLRDDRAPYEVAADTQAAAAALAATVRAAQDQAAAAARADAMERAEAEAAAAAAAKVAAEHRARAARAAEWAAFVADKAKTAEGFAARASSRDPGLPVFGASPHDFVAAPSAMQRLRQRAAAKLPKAAQVRVANARKTVAKQLGVPVRSVFTGGAERVIAARNAKKRRKRAPPPFLVPPRGPDAAERAAAAKAQRRADKARRRAVQREARHLSRTRLRPASAPAARRVPPIGAALYGRLTGTDGGAEAALHRRALAVFGADAPAVLAAAGAL